jgi:hypothetical protein
MKAQDIEIVPAETLVKDVTSAICLMLARVPALTATSMPFAPSINFIVRKYIDTVPSFEAISHDELMRLAKNIQIALVPILFFYGMDSIEIEKISLELEFSTYDALIRSMS